MSMDVGTKNPKSEINVTPLVDVVLVLLIIFMVITPIMLQATKVFIPKMEVTDDEPDPLAPKTLVIKLDADGSIALRVGDAEQVVSQEQLYAKLKAQVDARQDKIVFVDASELVAYGQVVSIFDLTKGIGAHVAVVDTDEVTEEDEG